MTSTHTLTISLLTVVLSLPALAHDGRRFEVQINSEGQLIAQGVNTGADDGAPAIRPYLNAIHGHWINFPSLGGAAANLPGFDLFNPTEALEGASLTLTLDNAFRWTAPPPMPPADATPVFEPLDASESIIISYGGSAGSTLSTDSFGGSLTLLDAVPVGGQGDLDLGYEIGLIPDDTIYILQFTLGTDAPGITDSDPVYAIMLPQGPSLHHAGLFTERYLGTPVPEPGSLAVLAVAAAASGTRRRR
ncbi:MAG: PEP-CTERM sorting domain-containing protein [Planctomycetota bacterium]